MYEYCLYTEYVIWVISCIPQHPFILHEGGKWTHSPVVSRTPISLFRIFYSIVSLLAVGMYVVSLDIYTSLQKATTSVPGPYVACEFHIHTQLLLNTMHKTLK